MTNKKFQVFVSSTYQDLKEARSEVIQAILNLLHFPAGMEMFGSTDQNQWQHIQEVIDNSDYYILIIGERYGSLNEDNVSYTEAEYDYAASQNIPILSFIRDENAPTTKSERDDDPILINKLNNFKGKVSANRLRSIWKDIPDLVNKVSVSLSKEIARNPQKGWVREGESNDPELVRQITRLLAENESLKDRLIEQDNPREPNIMVNINDDTPLELHIDPLPEYEIDSIEKYFIEIDAIPQTLKQYIDIEEVNTFNKCLPSEEEFNKSNVAKQYLYNIENCTLPIKILFSNIGTLTAKDIIIEISFPDFVRVFEKTAYSNGEKEFKDFYKDKIITVSESPVSKAEAEYNKAMIKEKNFSLYGRSDQNSLQSIIGGLNRGWFDIDNGGRLNHISLDLDRCLWVEENQSISIHKNSLLHTRTIDLSKYEIEILPLKVGKGEIVISIVCEEYLSDKLFKLPIEVT